MVKVTLFTVTFPVEATVTWSTDTLAVTVMVWPACMVMAPLALVGVPWPPVGVTQEEPLYRSQLASEFQLPVATADR